jgi:LAO/AO transport system kinase
MASGKSIAQLAERVVSGDSGAVSEALNTIDDNRPESRDGALTLLDQLEGHGRGARIGVTGAPGSGKSSLLDALVSALRKQDRSVGILAVDPSSQRTGGALLGDRMRLSSAARDAGVFLRSLAARDRLGGLSEVTGPSLDVMAAAFDVVFVETVGVGQSEAEVIDLVDSLIFVAQPAAGDLIQFMKAGILEWPDIFFVNKADLGDAARRTAAELLAGLELGNRRDADRQPPVLCGSATDGLGIDALIEAIDSHQAYLKSSGQGEKRRQAGRIARVRSAIAARYGRYGLDQLKGPLAIETFAGKRSEQSIARLSAELGGEVERALSAVGDAQRGD